MKNQTYKNQMKKLRKNIKKEDFKDSVFIIAEDYYKRSEEDRVLLEKVLKDFIIDIDKMSLLSLVIFTIAPIVNGIFGDDKKFTIFVYIILYVVLGWLIYYFTQKYRFYNLYIDTINNLREKKIVISKKIVKKVESDEKIELQYDSKVK